MNNILRVWELHADPTVHDGQFKRSLKCKLENGPAETDDILFCEWHPKGNAILCGGKDYMLWIMNGANGAFLASLGGHEDEVLCAKFTPTGKQIISSSADRTIRVWSPIKNQCIHVIRQTMPGDGFHEDPINVFELHPQQPLVVSGDLSGRVCFSNYSTGEKGRTLGQHGDSVEGIVFCKLAELPFFVSVAMDSKIIIYDWKDTKIR